MPITFREIPPEILDLSNPPQPVEQRVEPEPITEEPVKEEPIQENQDTKEILEIIKGLAQKVKVIEIEKPKEEKVEEKIPENKAEIEKKDKKSKLKAFLEKLLKE